MLHVHLDPLWCFQGCLPEEALHDAMRRLRSMWMT